MQDEHYGVRLQASEDPAHRAASKRSFGPQAAPIDLPTPGQTFNINDREDVSLRTEARGLGAVASAGSSRALVSDARRVAGVRLLHALVGDPHRDAPNADV